MLESLIKLNPYFRPTALECLKYKVFDPYRDSLKEIILFEMQSQRNQPNQNSSSGFQLQLPIDSEDVFNYQEEGKFKYSIDDLKTMIINEI